VVPAASGFANGTAVAHACTSVANVQAQNITSHRLLSPSRPAAGAHSTTNRHPSSRTLVAVDLNICCSSYKHMHRRLAPVAAMRDLVQYHDSRAGMHAHAGGRTPPAISDAHMGLILQTSCPPQCGPRSSSDSSSSSSPQPQPAQPSSTQAAGWTAATAPGLQCHCQGRGLL
jgi:hypothetical protein